MYLTKTAPPVPNIHQHRWYSSLLEFSLELTFVIVGRWWWYGVVHESYEI
jgi:hypothetical protein